mmetsp:Transcript_32261/g.62040  ORF Transcript_32261/g.62040 Transcript_32261/m.62040 type:complete len:156 (+) Transcript_32261:1353-1820(+)
MNSCHKGGGQMPYQTDARLFFDHACPKLNDSHLALKTNWYNCRVCPNFPKQFSPPALPWTDTLPRFSPTPVDECNKGASCVPAGDQNILRTRKNNKNEVVADPGRCTNLSKENSTLGWVPTHSIDASARVEQVHVVGIRNERRRHQPGRLLVVSS